MEKFCDPMSGYAAMIVQHRDAGEPDTTAVADLVEAMSNNDRSKGLPSDTMTETMIAVDMVQRVYKTPPPTVAQAAASIRTRCLGGMSTEPTLSPQSPSTPSDSLFQQGLADRQAWEAWLAKLTGAYRSGAEYWAGQRSVPKPKSCYGTAEKSSGDWLSGCREALRRLAPSDVWRKLEPEYRFGWNSFAATPANNSPTSSAGSSATGLLPANPSGEPQVGSDLPPARTQPVTGEASSTVAGTIPDRHWFGISKQKRACLPIEQGGYGPVHSPDEVIAKLNSEPGQAWIPMPPAHPLGVPKDDVVVISAIGIALQIVLVRGLDNCLAVMHELRE